MNQKPVNNAVVRRVLISLPPALLAAVDRQAKTDYTTRSELIRRALLEYLRPVESRTEEFDEPDDQNLYTDPDELFEILRKRKLRAGIQQMLKDMKRQQRG